MPRVSSQNPYSSTSGQVNNWVIK